MKATDSAALFLPPNPCSHLQPGNQILVHQETKLKSQESHPKNEWPRGNGTEGRDAMNSEPLAGRK